MGTLSLGSFDLSIYPWGGLFIVAFPHFLAPWDSSGFSYISPAPGLPTIGQFSKELWFLLLEMVLETVVWALGVLVATGYHCFLGPPRGQSTKYVWVLIHVYTSIYKYFFTYPSLSLLVWAWVLWWCLQDLPIYCRDHFSLPHWLLITSPHPTVRNLTLTIFHPFT